MPKSLYFVLLVLVWVSGQVLDDFARYAIKVDYFVWESLGVPFLHFVFSLVSGALLVAAIAYLLRPRPIGLQVTLAALGWGALYGAALTALAIRDLENVRTLYMLGREVRGLSVRPEAADLIFTPSGMWASYLVALAFLCVSGGIVYRHRQWFHGGARRAA